MAVIEGADRYLEEVGKFTVDQSKAAEATDASEEDEYEDDDMPSRPSSFLKKIQDFFEKDGM